MSTTPSDKRPVPLSVRLPPGVHAEFTAIARRHRWSYVEVVTMMIELTKRLDDSAMKHDRPLPSIATRAAAAVEPSGMLALHDRLASLAQAEGRSLDEVAGDLLARVRQKPRRRG